MGRPPAVDVSRKVESTCQCTHRNRERARDHAIDLRGLRWAHSCVCVCVCACVRPSMQSYAHAQCTIPKSGRARHHANDLWMLHWAQSGRALGRGIVCRIAIKPPEHHWTRVRPCDRPLDATIDSVGGAIGHTVACVSTIRTTTPPAMLTPPPTMLTITRPRTAAPQYV